MLTAYYEITRTPSLMPKKKKSKIAVFFLASLLKIPRGSQRVQSLGSFTFKNRILTYLIGH